ncbi:MAG: 4Fe-4S dicluster domain-containing protein [Longimicrobiales bacterium]
MSHDTGGGPLGEAAKTAGVRVEPGRSYGFFTDTTLCIGCKACEVACKQWNQLPAEPQESTGQSYDNTRQFSATTWRHVRFIEQFDADRFGSADQERRIRDAALRVAERRQPVEGEPPVEGQTQRDLPAAVQPWGHWVAGEAWADPAARWLLMSDVCKHCVHAPCLEACPTGSLIRTEFDSVFIQQDVCNGCGYCQSACPFGVIEVDKQGDGKAHKCTLCYDRLKDGLEPACAKSCPTDSIQFGPVDELLERASRRVTELRARGVPAYLYGSGGIHEDACDTSALGGLNCFFLLIDEPEVYNLPPLARRPSERTAGSLLGGLLSAAGLAAATYFALGGDDA